MTFTYDLSTDIGRVRLRIGDRIQLTDTEDDDTESGIRSDEEIQLMIDDEGSWQKACIAWVHSRLNELSTEPDSKADWLSIDLESTRESLQKMLVELKTWLGVSGTGKASNTVVVWRGDSNQTKAPTDWEE